MYATVLHATVTDEQGLHRAWDTALATLRSTATRWLGAVSGLTDGEFIAILVFESSEAGAITMDDLSEGPTWSQLTTFTDTMTFHHCKEVRASNLYGAGEANVVELSRAVAADIGRVVEKFDRTVQGASGGEASGVLCWDDQWFVATAIQRQSSADRMPTPSHVLGRDDEPLADHRVGASVTRPWSVLRLGGSP